MSDPSVPEEVRLYVRAAMGRYHRRKRAQSRALIARLSPDRKSHAHTATLVTAPASEGDKSIVLDEIAEERCLTCNVLMGLPS